MELLFVAVIAAGVGLGLRYTFPGRGEYGVLLLPAVSVAASCITWVALTWLGLPWDGFWIWAATMLATLVPALPMALLLPNRRRAEDEAKLNALLR